MKACGHCDACDKRIIALACLEPKVYGCLNLGPCCKRSDCKGQCYHMHVHLLANESETKIMVMRQEISGWGACYIGAWEGVHGKAGSTFH